MKSDGKTTLADALSPEMRSRLVQLRNDLLQRTQETIKTQIGQPKAPWQARAAGTASTVGGMPKQARHGQTGGIRSTGTLQPRISAQKPRFASQSRSAAPAPKIELPPFEYWDLPPQAAVREPPPSTISIENRLAFGALVESGATASLSPAGEEVFATIGLDFGTSTTKVIVRFPYEPGAPAIAVPAPVHCQSMGHPYLWQTVLWVNGVGEFTGWPHENAYLLHALKQSMMRQSTIGGIAPNGSSGLGVTSIEAAAAFLALVVRHTRGWLFAHRSQLFRNRRAVWFLNLGMPVANIDNGALVSAYRQTAAAAVLLANLDGPLTVEATRLFLVDPHVRAAARSAAAAEQLGIAVLPETAAEAAGFAKSTNRAPGLYLMVDVGAMTLDVCTFRLSERASESDLYALCCAQVRPLGVEAYYWFTGTGKTEDGFVEQCNRCLWWVVWETKKNKDPRAECWESPNELPVFLTGGGAENALHRRIVGSLTPWLRQHAQNKGVRILELPKPTNIDLPMDIPHFGRLAVAWGLSYPPSEIGEIFPPSAVKDKQLPSAVDWTRRFVSKDMV